MPRRLYESTFGTPATTATPSTLPTPTPTPPVPPEDLVPDLEDGEIDVWLTEWQVEEDGFDVAVGERIEWPLYEMDQQWVDRILRSSRNVSRRLTFYPDELSEAERMTRRETTGVIVRIDQVSTRYTSSEDPAERGVSVPETRGGQQHMVSSLSERRPHHGDITGWIVRIRS